MLTHPKWTASWVTLGMEQNLTEHIAEAHPVHGLFEDFFFWKKVL